MNRKRKPYTLDELKNKHKCAFHVSLEKPCAGLQQMEMQTCIAKPRGC